MKLFKTFAAIAISATVAFSGTVSADGSFPTRPVRIVLPYGVGGTTDIIGRAMAERLSKQWGQPVVVENKPGASDVVAATAVAKSPADGYTLLLASDAAFVTNGFLRKSLQYDPRTDFAPITRVAEGFGVIVVRPDLPARNLKEFLDLIQSRPGEINFGSEAVASAADFRMRILGQLSGGYKMNHIPYNGMSPILVDLLGGRLDSAWLPPHMAAPQITAGKLVGIASNGSKRNWIAPSVPTMDEQGYKGADVTFKMMLAAPAGTPRPIVDKIAKDVIAIMQDAEFNEKVVRPSGSLATAFGPEEFQRYLDTTRPALAKVAKDAGFVPQ